MHSRRPILRKCRSLLLAFFLASVSMGGTERHWIAHEAPLIVVGTLRIRLTYPWFDGWHITGTIAVEQVLYGPRTDPQIEYEYVCRWAVCNEYWRVPSLSSLTKAKELWFLRAAGGKIWRPSLDTGCRDLEKLKEYIRTYRQR
jgi:hypothetical protein